ncbi:MAG: (Fe-S)-binding protein [Bacteroidota bacterium]|nr:(Fe-S)-binding protein [Bacteroidota bacterium]
MKVSLFIPCLTDLFFPSTAWSVVRVLERLGIDVVYDPRQTCCGQPAFNTGYHRDAVVCAEHFLDVFHEAECIVAPSGSCVAMIRDYSSGMLRLPDRYRRLAERLKDRVWEFTSFLVDHLGVTEVDAEFPGRVALHDSCHALRLLGIRAQPRALLKRVRGLELVELGRTGVCCGFGGTFAVKFADISTEIGKEKIRDILDAQVRTVTAVDSSCLMQIDGLLRKTGSTTTTVHIADILASTGQP